MKKSIPTHLGSVLVSLSSVVVVVIVIQSFQVLPLVLVLVLVVSERRQHNSVKASTNYAKQQQQQQQNTLCTMSQMNLLIQKQPPLIRSLLVLIFTLSTSKSHAFTISPSSTVTGRVVAAVGVGNAVCYASSPNHNHHDTEEMETLMTTPTVKHTAAMITASTLGLVLMTTIVPPLADAATTLRPSSSTTEKSVACLPGKG